MDNMNQTANPTQVNGGDIYGGLTKIEYAAIEFTKAALTAMPHWEAQGYPFQGNEQIAKDSIAQAKALFEVLDKE